MEKKKITDFTTKGPILLYLEEERAEMKSGCSILDVTFTDPVAIGEIAFRNYYTAHISISCKKVPVEKDVRKKTVRRPNATKVRSKDLKIRGFRDRDTLPWQVLLKHHVLMTDPHCEQGSQDNVILSPKVSSIHWTGVVLLRIVLKQPSAHWRKFSIEDLSFYREMLTEHLPTTFVPRMFAVTKPDLRNGIQDKEQQPTTFVSRMFAVTKPDLRNGIQDKGSTRDSVSSAGDAPATLQTLKNITELMKTMHTGATVGRFELDGSYDVSHLI